MDIPSEVRDAVHTRAVEEAEMARWASAVSQSRAWHRKYAGDVKARVAIDHSACALAHKSAFSARWMRSKAGQLATGPHAVRDRAVIAVLVRAYIKRTRNEG